MLHYVDVSRVLVLEPDRDVRELLVRMLRQLRHEPMLEPDGEADVVLLEPGSTTARQTLADVRERRPDVYVVCASIYPREDAASLEPDAFLSKPIDVANLEAALRDAG